MIRNRKKEPLLGADIIAQFPDGIIARSWIHPRGVDLKFYEDKKLGGHVIQIPPETILIPDQSNSYDQWWVNLNSLFQEEEDEEGRKLIKPEYKGYCLIKPERTDIIVAR